MTEFARGGIVKGTSTPPEYFNGCDYVIYDKTAQVQRFVRMLDEINQSLDKSEQDVVE